MANEPKGADTVECGRHSRGFVKLELSLLEMSNLDKLIREQTHSRQWTEKNV